MSTNLITLGQIMFLHVYVGKIHLLFFLFLLRSLSFLLLLPFPPFFPLHPTRGLQALLVRMVELAVQGRRGLMETLVPQDHRERRDNQ